MLYRREGWRARTLLQLRGVALETGFRDEQAHALAPGREFRDGVLSGTILSRLPIPGTARVLGGTLGLGTNVWNGRVRLSFDHGGFGGRFDFNRVRVEIGKGFRLWSFGIAGVQAEWAAADSGTPPQELFYIGGNRTLQGYPKGSVQARQLYLLRGQAALGDDILRTIHVPHPPFLAFSLGLFAETAAAPALDPGHGLGPERPRGGDWISDVGVGLWHRPGMLDPLSFLKFNAAIGVGKYTSHKVRYVLTFSRVVDWF